MNGHPAHEEDFDLYALGVLEGEEKEAIESHIASCAACAGKLGEARGRIALLAFAAPRTEPSPAVRERLLRQLHEAPVSRASTVGHGEGRREGGSFGSWWGALLAPAAVVLALATVFLWTENRRLDEQIAGLRASMQEQQKQLDYARNVAHLFEAKDTITVSLAPMPGMPKGAAKVMYNEKMGVIMYDGWIEPPPDDKSYQLWVVPMEGNPISVGVFNPATSDSAHWMTKMPEGVPARAFAITLEPAGGAPEPTGPKVLAGPVS
ncbi:MAG: anti-sigma factor [Candidatus Acidiferrales bacterium]